MTTVNTQEGLNVSEAISREDLAESIGKNLGNLSLRVCRWTGRLIAKDVEVKDGEADVTGKVTNPRWHLDSHPL